MSHNKNKVPYKLLENGEDAAEEVLYTRGAAAVSSTHEATSREEALGRASVGAEGLVRVLPQAMRRPVMLMRSLDLEQLKEERDHDRDHTFQFLDPEFEWQPTTSLKTRIKLMGRSGLTGKLIERLANDNDEKRFQPRALVQRMRGIADKRVEKTMVPELLGPPITMDELFAYSIGITYYAPPSPFVERLRFPTDVEPLPQFPEASCFTPITQLQTRLDELIKIQKEKYTMLLNLQRIHFASNDPSNIRDAETRDRPYGMHTWRVRLGNAERMSGVAILDLRDQLQELGQRIHILREKITKIKKRTCSLLGGSKTKSKYTKSNKSKRRNRKYSKRN